MLRRTESTNYQSAFRDKRRLKHVDVCDFCLKTESGTAVDCSSYLTIHTWKQLTSAAASDKGSIKFCCTPTNESAETKTEHQIEHIQNLPKNKRTKNKKKQKTKTKKNKKQNFVFTLTPAINDVHCFCFCCFELLISWSLHLFLCTEPSVWYRDCFVTMVIRHCWSQTIIIETTTGFPKTSACPRVNAVRTSKPPKWQVLGFKGWYFEKKLAIATRVCRLTGHVVKSCAEVFLLVRLLQRQVVAPDG